MYQKVNTVTRLYYLLTAVLLFSIGMVLMLSFFMIIPMLFGLAAWAWAGIFLYLAVGGRHYSDFVAMLTNTFSDRFGTG